ncbi:MAG: hypothetical protein GVY16_09425 [Planctomycetes bacterium]|jgi:hypothetical protein|nr:hypothetical protein [Phycisphaerae bacterium]NBB95944.1 hypothetical protein [Planctomycetota bacterium]
MVIVACVISAGIGAVCVWWLSLGATRDAPGPAAGAPTPQSPGASSQAPTEEAQSQAAEAFDRSRVKSVNPSDAPPGMFYAVPLARDEKLTLYLQVAEDGRFRPDWSGTYVWYPGSAHDGRYAVVGMSCPSQDPMPDGKQWEATLRVFLPGGMSFEEVMVLRSRQNFMGQPFVSSRELDDQCPTVLGAMTLGTMERKGGRWVSSESLYIKLLCRREPITATAEEEAELAKQWFGTAVTGALAQPVSDVWLDH